MAQKELIERMLKAWINDHVNAAFAQRGYVGVTILPDVGKGVIVREHVQSFSCAVTVKLLTDDKPEELAGTLNGVYDLCVVHDSKVYLRITGMSIELNGRPMQWAPPPDDPGPIE